MGAIEAFTETFSIMLREKRIYVLVLILTLILAPIGAYIMPKDVPLEANRTVTHQGGVIVEEYGSPGESAILPELEDFLKKAIPYVILAIILSTIFEYGVVRGALGYLEGERIPSGRLLMEGVRHFPQVFVINLLFSLMALALIGIPLVLILAGALLLPAGAAIVILGVLLLIPVAAFVTAMATLPVPIYTVRRELGSAFEAIHLSFRNLKTSLGFGFLLWIGAIGISIVSAPISILSQLLAPPSYAPYVSAFLQAPFTALLYEFIWVAGVAFYKELRRMEEMKKVDEELAELGIEI